MLLYTYGLSQYILRWFTIGELRENKLAYEALEDRVYQERQLCEGTTNLSVPVYVVCISRQVNPTWVRVHLCVCVCMSVTN